MIRRVCFLAIVLIAGSCKAPEPETQSRVQHYVNMGSSFAAGLSVPPSAKDAPPRCGRSAKNYAQLLAAKRGLALNDVSCSGAASIHLLEKWNELPAQIEAVRSDTALVTITIGGNDLNYVGNLIAASCDENDKLIFAERSVPCPSHNAPTEDAFQQLETNLMRSIQQIKARAPQAQIVFIQYITLVPERQCPQTRLTAQEAASLRSIGSRLAAVTQTVAQNTRALVLPSDALSVEHTPCNPQPWSAGFPKGLNTAETVPWHPNSAAMNAIAAELDRLLSEMVFDQRR